MTGVRVLRDYVLELVFDPGEIRVIDMPERMIGPLFEPVGEDYGLVRQVGVDGGTIMWPTGAAWNPSQLYDK